MFTLSIKPKYVEIENLMDTLIKEPLVIVSDKKLLDAFGIYAKELRTKRLLHSSPDRNLHESALILKCSDYYTPGVVRKTKNGKKINYVFEVTNIPKIRLPEI